MSTRIDALAEELRNRDDQEGTEKMIQDNMMKFQADNIDILSKRIDSNENHIKLLETKDDELEGRLNELEKADIYLQASLAKQL